LLAQTLCLIENMDGKGVGTTGMIEHCRKASLPEPEFDLNGGFLVTLRRKPAPMPAPPAAGEAAGQVSKEVMQLLKACKKDMTRQELQASLGLKAEENFRQHYLVPALENGLIEMTIPDKPKSRLQKYRLTDKGKNLLASLPD